LFFLFQKLNLPHIQSHHGFPKPGTIRRYLNSKNIKQRVETYSTFLHISDSLNNEEFLTNSTEHFQPILQFKATDDEPIRTIYETSHRIFHTGCHGTIIFSWNSKQNIEVQRYDYDERGSSGLQIIKEVAKKDNDAYFFGSLGTPGWCFVENILPLKYTGRYGLLILNLARK